MIRLERPDVGATAAARVKLAGIETAELARVGALIAAADSTVGGAAAPSKVRCPSNKEIGTRYAEVKPTLVATQFGKCCYCEKPIESAETHVEHFRPKAQAKCGEGFSDDGYWWLAWHWSNLMGACLSCNSVGKGVHFPLHPTSLRLGVGDLPPGREQPMLIDPLRESPIEHIQFRAFPHIRSGLWLPTARGGSPRGEETIRKLGLARPALHDHYCDHFVSRIVPRLKELREAEGSDRTFADQWRRTVVSLLSPSVPFVALSYDVLVEKASVERRRELGLSVPLPPYRP